MPPATFRNNRCEDTPKSTPKRKAATFRGGQSPLPKQQRTFGTDITNNACHARPVFKQGRAECAAKPVKRPLELRGEPRRPATPVKFVAARDDAEPAEVELDTSPLARPSAPRTPLATLIETRCSELKTRSPFCEAVDVDVAAFEPYNAVCALGRDTIIMNPRQIPLARAQIHRYNDKACIAGLW